MADEITVPRLGWSMEEGTFVEWLKREGDFVRAGEALFAIEGDKAIQEVESLADGILRISPSGPEHGDTVKVGTILGYLVGKDEQVPAAAATRPAAPGDGRSAVVETAAAPRSNPKEDQSGGQQRISPRAARVAAELGIDCQTVRGTGRSGRIRERDVRAAASAAPAPSVAPSFRKRIAARMSAGANSTAPVTLTTTAQATNLVSLRGQFKSAAASIAGAVPSYLDMLIKLSAGALVRHPELNQQWIDDQIVRPAAVHIAIAVDTPAGLLAPVVRDVAALGLRDIAARTAELKMHALAGTLTPEDLSGGTFTITNLGAFGIDAFTPIITVPQCAVLGIGRIERRPAVVGEQIVAQEQMTLSLTFDHRIVDGAPAARFLATLRGAIENPGPWLVP